VTVVSPISVYRRLPEHLKRLMVVTANGQAIVAFERVMLEFPVPRTVLGVSELSLVTAIERTKCRRGVPRFASAVDPKAGGEPASRLCRARLHARHGGAALGRSVVSGTCH